MEKVHYISQLDYAHLAYPTTMKRGEPLQKPYPSVAEAGCGLCCVCMLVEALTGERMTVEECIKLSVKAGANTFGTDMMCLGLAAAEKYGLSMTAGCDPLQLGDCLERGGCAVVNAGRKNGIFSRGGHFLLAARKTGDLVWVLDPSYTEEKYFALRRSGVVKQEGNYILVDLEIIERECRNRNPSYFMFFNSRNIL